MEKKTMTLTDEQTYSILEGVARQAVIDVGYALRALYRNSWNRQAWEDLEECIDFFNSPLCPSTAWTMMRLTIRKEMLRKKLKEMPSVWQEALDLAA